MARDGLAVLAQDDFSAGAFPSFPRDAIPLNGLEDAVNALISDAGLPYRRGGSSYQSNAALGGGARLLWDGILAPGPRTVWAYDQGSGNMALYTLDSDDVTPYDTTVFVSGGFFQKPAVIQGMLVIGGSNPLIYAGSRGGPGIAIGNVTATQNSPTVTGTALDTKYAAGQLFSVDGTSWYAISAVASGSLTLATNFREATVTTTGQRADTAFGAIPKAATIYLTVAGKLLAMSGDSIWESDPNNPFSFQSTNLVQVPAGVTILGAEALRGDALIFTTAGIYLLSNVGLALTDLDGNLQQRLDVVNRDLILWSWAGVVNWGAGLIVPATDGVWLMDGISSPARITGGFDLLYRSYVAAGYKTGYATVFNNHYLLPILDSNNGFVDALVCRLTPTNRGTAYGWTRLAGDGAQMAGFATRIASGATRTPYLLGAHRSNARICRLPYFEETNATDADGTAHVCTLVTREFSLRNAVRNLFKRLKVHYELTDPGTSNPTLSAEYAEDSASYTSMGTAAEAAITAPANFTASGATQRTYGIRFRLQTANAASRFLLHALEVFVRPNERQS